MTLHLRSVIRRANCRLRILWSGAGTPASDLSLHTSLLFCCYLPRDPFQKTRWWIDPFLHFIRAATLVAGSCTAFSTDQPIPHSVSNDCNLGVLYICQIIPEFGFLLLIVLEIPLERSNCRLGTSLICSVRLYSLLTTFLAAVVPFADSAFPRLDQPVGLLPGLPIWCDCSGIPRISSRSAAKRSARRISAATPPVHGTPRAQSLHFFQMGLNSRFRDRCSFA